MMDQQKLCISGNSIFGKNKAKYLMSKMDQRKHIDMMDQWKLSALDMMDQWKLSALAKTKQNVLCP